MIRGIVLDKDGTLLDYERFWLPVAEGALSDMLRARDGEAPLLGALLSAIGARDGITGVLCYGTYGMITECINRVLVEAGLATVSVEEVSGAFAAHVEDGEIIPTCADQRGLLTGLRARGLQLGVVTSDNASLTGICLEALGIADCFDAVLCDDGTTPPKPAPGHMEAFCRRFGLRPHEVLMVGDTPTDMSFAENSGAVAVGVAATEVARGILAPRAAFVIKDISELGFLDKLESND